MKKIAIAMILSSFQAVTQSSLNTRTDYIKETKILNYSAPSIQKLIKDKKWLTMDTIERAKSIYNFVRNDIKFGYNISDYIPASEILEDGYGQCNTKATLLMALLRACDIPNRIHGFTIDKALQKGAISGIWYTVSPKNILHSWVEVYVNTQWYFLEGVILDEVYLTQLQIKNNDCKTTFCGYGVYTDFFDNPPVEWNLNHTYIQDKGINQDFGTFDTPDEFYAQHKQELGTFKQFIFKKIVRKKMNKNVRKIREGQ